MELRKPRMLGTHRLESYLETQNPNLGKTSERSTNLHSSNLPWSMLADEGISIVPVLVMHERWNSWVECAIQSQATSKAG
jgi:hypothetical protein